MDLFSQDLNPVTGDIGFNPASFGLSLKDIDQAASIKLKAALTSGGLALTQEQYREVQKISETKYQGLDAKSGIFNGSVLPAVNMSSKDPGLYLTQEYMGYWTGTEWSSYIGNNGNFEFQGNATNYIRWNGTSLDIRGVLQMLDGTPVEDYVQANGTKPMVNSQYDSGLDKYKQWLNAGDLLPYTIPGSATGVYLTSAGLFGVKNGVNQFSISTATGDAMFRGTVYASGGEFSGNITASGTITGGLFRGGAYETFDPNVPIGSRRYTKIELGKMSLQNASNIDIVSIDGSNFRYINADAFISANTHHAFQTTAEILSGFGSVIGFDFGSYNDQTKAFSSYGSKLLFTYNSPTSVDSLTGNDIRNFTAPNYTTTGPIVLYKGYAHFSYLINASFVGRMKIPVGNNLY